VAYAGLGEFQSVTFECKFRSLYCRVVWPHEIKYCAVGMAGWVGIGVIPRDSGVVEVEVEVAVLCCAQLNCGKEECGTIPVQHGCYKQTSWRYWSISHYWI